MSTPDVRATETSADAASGRSPARRRRAGIAVVVALVVLLAAAALGADLFASSRYRASGDPGSSLAVRLAAAQEAERFWPFAGAYRIRVVTLRGLQFYQGGNILGAYDLLHKEYVREYIAKSFDRDLVAAHATVYLAYYQASSRTAHVMHGLEQPNGTILPQDVQHFPRPPKTP